jgi:hypothetical protein
MQQSHGLRRIAILEKIDRHSTVLQKSGITTENSHVDRQQQHKSEQLIWTKYPTRRNISANKAKQSTKAIQANILLKRIA